MQHFSKSEILLLLAQAKASSERDWLMILVAFNHGFRASEVVGKRGFTAHQIADGYITVQRLKGSKKTSQPLVKDADPLLDETRLIDYTSEMPGNQIVFPISRVHFWRLVQKYGKAAKLPEHKCHPHALKHSIAKQTIQSAGVHNVRQYLGHKSLASTGAYLEVDDSEASAAIGAARIAK